jgi:hypothetical protein
MAAADKISKHCAIADRRRDLSHRPLARVWRRLFHHGVHLFGMATLRPRRRRRRDGNNNVGRPSSPPALRQTPKLARCLMCRHGASVAARMG